MIFSGTRMGISGYGEGVAAGTGSSIKGTIIGVWFRDNHPLLTDW